VSRIRILFSILILGVAVSVPTACNTDSSSSNFSDKKQTSASAPPADAPTFRPVPVTTGPPKGRDPLMEQGAQFMATVMDHKRQLEKNPKNKEALRFLGNANFDIDRFEAAKAYYTRYLEIDPAQPEVRTDLATSYYKTRDVDSAVRELRSVVAQYPDHAAALYNLGLILKQDKGDNHGAIKAWEALLQSHPDHPKSAEIRREIEVMKKS
jgi:cytochrome c-type biogenesis protein CcmH/NrfG